MGGMMDSVVAIILGGGRGTRLAPLTNYRSKPAVPLAGKYRLVDLPISNCINSGVYQIYVLTQFESASLNAHVTRTYTFDNFRGGFVEIIAAEQRYHQSKWFQGTADAIRQTYHHTVGPEHEYVLILAGDALYRMDYSDLLLQHIQGGADLSIACKTVDAQDATDFGLMKIDAEKRILEFTEKPPADKLPPLAMDAATLEKNNLDSAKPYLASMGIYLFNKEVLARYAHETELNDFGKEVIPDAVANLKVLAYPFDDYWEDIGTIKAFYRANLDLTEWEPAFNLYDARAPIYTRRRFLPGPKVLDCDVTKVIFGEGSIITAARLFHSIVGVRAVVRRGATLENTIMMGAEYYEDDDPEAESTPEAEAASGIVPLGVGENCIIRNAILDLNVRVGRDVKIINVERKTEYEAELYTIRDGIVIVGKGTTIPDGTVI